MGRPPLSTSRAVEDADCGWTNIREGEARTARARKEPFEVPHFSSVRQPMPRSIAMGSPACGRWEELPRRGALSSSAHWFFGATALPRCRALAIPTFTASRGAFDFDYPPRFPGRGEIAEAVKPSGAGSIATNGGWTMARGACLPTSIRKRMSRWCNSRSTRSSRSIIISSSARAWRRCRTGA